MLKTHDADVPEKRFTLRMNGKIFEEISKSAKFNRRSVAKEIEQAVAFYLTYYEDEIG